jgi:UDP:flavonoid glycosyltransferase YjiC (YdhE family)
MARWARESGAEVHFACGARHASVARSEGLEPVVIETVAPEAFYSRLSRGRFFYRLEELQRYLRAELELIARVNPDLVVGDFRLTLPLSAQLAGVRCLSLANAHWSPAAPRELSAPEGGPFGALPGFARRALFAAISPLAYRLFAAPLDRLRRSVGLAPLRDFREHYVAGDGCAYLDLPELFPAFGIRHSAFGTAAVPKAESRQPKADVPAGHFFLGPVLWQPRGLPEPELGSLGLERPLAYVSTGSSGSARHLPETLRALLAGGFDLAISGLGDSEQAGLRARLPALAGRSVMGRLFAPERVLARARLVVCHGGSGTVYQALTAGVPVLCRPENQDQHLVTRAVEAAGAGMCLDPRHIEEQLVGLAGGRCAPEARRLSDAIRRHDTRRRWIDFLSSCRVPAVAGWPGFKFEKEISHGADAHLERDLCPSARGVRQLHGERPGPA